MKFNQCAFLLGVLLSSIAFGRDIHVAKTGADSNDGSIDKPYLTISKAADVAGPGDVCFIHAGTYEETLKPTKSGTSVKPIVFQSYPGDKVIIEVIEPMERYRLRKA